MVERSGHDRLSYKIRVVFFLMLCDHSSLSLHEKTLTCVALDLTTS